MFGNVSDKGRELIIESGDIRFLTVIGWNVAGDDYCAGVTIKNSTHQSPLDFLSTI